MMKSLNKTEGLKQTIRRWNVQKTPYVKPLQFYSSTRRQTQYHGMPLGQIVGDTMASACNALVQPEAGMIDRLIFDARASAVSEAKGGAQASTGVAIAEWKSSLDMIAGALRSLTSKKARAKRYYDRKASEVYLEGVFGWLPLMQDIHNAAKVLSDGMPPSRVRKRMRATTSYKLPAAHTNAYVQVNAGVQIGCTLRIDNPNVALLNNLGLLNPASVAWELVPYSFVLDWFVPVGTYLNSLNDTIGFSVDQAFYTVFTSKSVSGKYYNTLLSKPDWKDRACSCVTVQRWPGLPAMPLPSVSMPQANLGKALTALALFDKTREPPVSYR